MSDNEFQLYQEAVDALNESYPSREIKLHWDIDRWYVSVDGNDQFTIKGYNLLYCLTKLVESLKDELR